ncbi:MAG: SUMF1/EgtB/PvdO family nonheme iron enzyme, partial [Candidatus Omnitrophica bacterium]|nr:SUMF1/EgtB/PvdO family nonheme iron enzyme [Candidatus Omnitrophota bacterium]
MFVENSTLEANRCIIAKNESSGQGGGIGCESATMTLNNCVCVGNFGSEGRGGIASDSSVITFTNGILWNFGTEVRDGGGLAPEITYSCVQSGLPGVGNINAYPLFVDPDNEDYRLQDGSPCIDGGTDLGMGFNGAAPDMGAWEAPGDYTQGATQHVPTLLRVDADMVKGGGGDRWADALPSISDALFLCSASDEIWVAEGTYHENISFEPGLRLFGGFSGDETARDQRDPGTNLTTIESPGNSQTVVTVQNVEKTTMDGFSIVNSDFSQRGFTYQDVDSATLNNCRIHGQLFIFFSFPDISNCVVTGAEQLEFGGVRCSYSNPTFFNCEITENKGRTGAGVSCYSSNPVFRNVRITRNEAYYIGGGFYCVDSNPELINCTIADNTGDRGSAMDLTYSNPVITNSILSNPQGVQEDEISTGDPLSAAIISYSIVAESEGGEFNIDTDPLLVDPESGDYRLQPTSPCIDAGNPDPMFNDDCLPPGQGTVRNDMGYTGGTGNCQVLTGSTVPTLTPTPTITPTPGPGCDSGYYILDSYGGRHRVGEPNTITGSLYFGYDIARDLEKASVSIGQATDLDLVVLDGSGVAHFIEYPDHSIPQMFYFGDQLNEFPQGRAVDLELSADSQGLWVLTDFGGIYRSGSALDDDPVMVPNTDGFALGWDVPIEAEIRAPGLEAPGGATLRAVSLVVIDTDEDNIADGFVIVDSMGGHYQIDNDGNEFAAGSSDGSPENSPERLLDPAAYVWPFFGGLDIARDAELHPSQRGVVIFDGWGGIHPVPVDVTTNPVFYANNRQPDNPTELITTVGMPYIVNGFAPPDTPAEEIPEIDAASIFMDLEFSVSCGNGFYTLDRFGGVFAFGAARFEPDNLMPPYSGSPYFYPQPLAESMEIFGAAETDFDTASGSIITIDLPGLQKGAKPLRLVRIPAGTYMMGARDGQVGADLDEYPRHEVTIGYDFYIGQTEITQAQFYAVTGRVCNGPCSLPDHPLSLSLNSNSNSLNVFLEELNSQTGLSFRLPSEAEWEYACRAGSETRFHFGEYEECTFECRDCVNPANGIRLTDFAVYCYEPGEGGLMPVGSLLPNAWGL